MDSTEELKHNICKFCVYSFRLVPGTVLVHGMAQALTPQVIGIAHQGQIGLALTLVTQERSHQHH